MTFAVNFLPAAVTPSKSIVHFLPSRVQRPSPKPPSAWKTHERIPPSALSFPNNCVPDSVTLPPSLTVYLPRMNVLFSSHSYVVVTSRSLLDMFQVPMSHSRSFRLSSALVSRSHSWTIATFHSPPSRARRVLRQLDEIRSPASFFSRSV